MPPGNWSLAAAMAAARFCFSPRGWDMGDSDRYLPAVLRGCVPLMSDRVEGMPLQASSELNSTPVCAWSWGKGGGGGGGVGVVEGSAIASAARASRRSRPSH